MPTLFVNTSYVDPTRLGTWQDPHMYPSAMAPNGHSELLWFRLSHEHQTARLLRAIPRESAGSSMFGTWVLADVEPYQGAREPETLPGLTLRLQGYPWNGTAEYRIVEPV